MITTKELVRRSLDPEISVDDQGRVSIETPIGSKHVAEVFGSISTPSGNHNSQIKAIFYKNFFFVVCKGTVIQRYKLTTVREDYELGYGASNDTSLDDEALSYLRTSGKYVAPLSKDWRPKCAVFTNGTDRMKVWVMGKSYYGGVSFEWDASKQKMTCSDPSVAFGPENMMWHGTQSTWYTYAPSGTYRYLDLYENLSQRRLVSVTWRNNEGPKYSNDIISWDASVENFALQVESRVKGNLKWKYEIYENNVLLASNSYGM
jgi:hypothetical protein